MAKHCWF